MPWAVSSSRILESQSVLPRKSRRVVSVNWIADVNSDGRMDVLLPQPEGMCLFLMTDDISPLESRVLEFEPATSVTGESGQNYVVTRLPRILATM